MPELPELLELFIIVGLPFAAGGLCMWITLRVPPKPKVDDPYRHKQAPLAPLPPPPRTVRTQTTNRRSWARPGPPPEARRTSVDLWRPPEGWDPPTNT